MKFNFGIARTAILLAALTALTGCATPALWAKRTYQPAEHPHLMLGLAPSGTNVLVCYDERGGKSLKSHRRAYWLFVYTARMNKHPKPRFTDPSICLHLNPVAVFDPEQTNTPRFAGYYATAGPDSRSFRLCRDGQEAGIFSLPVYSAAAPASFWRIALTPVAVATDAVIVSAAIYGAGGGAAM
jgi:hypothetical protein